MRARHLLAEGVILLLSGFAVFAQGPEGTGVKANPSKAEESSAATANSTSGRAASPDQQQPQQQSNADKNSSAPSSSNAAPASTPVATAGATQEEAAKAASSSHAMQTTQSGSLGDAARKAREKKSTNTSTNPNKPGKVFTNDDLANQGGPVNVVGQPSSNNAAPDTSAPKGSASLDEQEKGWRAKFAKAHAKLQRDQAELDVEQREMGKLQVQYYPNDPSKQLSQSLTNEDIRAQQDKIAKKQQDIQNDQNEISNLEDSLRKSGGDPGWAR